MSVTNPQKTISSSRLDCDGRTTVTLSFDAMSELSLDPAEIVLIMDRSGSMNGAPMTAAKAAAKRLIEMVARASGSSDGSAFENASQMGMVSFAETATADVQLTGDAAAMNAAVNAMQASGLTNHREAFEAAVAMLPGTSGKRRIIVMFTDGVTTAGGDADQVAEAAKADGIEIFGIGLLQDPAQLNQWASDPTDTHVAYTDSTAKLTQVFEEIAAEVVTAGALDALVQEQLSPDFKIVRVNAPSHGTVDVTGPQNFDWKLDAAGAASPETASVSFEVMHIGADGGNKQVNQSVTYTDRAGAVLDFPNPSVDVSCTGPVVMPETCPLPTTFIAESCKDAVQAVALDTVMQSLGRIVQVDATVKNVCPGKQVAVAILLSELDGSGTEHARGTKTMLIPAHNEPDCRDVLIKCISFVVPEALDPSGDTGSICNPRGFRTRVLANYVDTDFVCCDSSTVVL